MIERRDGTKSGVLWMRAPIGRYNDLVSHLKDEIGKKLMGRKNSIRGVLNYSSYDEFMKQE